MKTIIAGSRTCEEIMNVYEAVEAPGFEITPVYKVWTLTCTECALTMPHQPCEACPNDPWRKEIDYSDKYKRYS